MFKTNIIFVIILFVITGCTIATKTTSELGGGKFQEIKKEKLGLFGWEKVPIKD